VLARETSWGFKSPLAHSSWFHRARDRARFVVGLSAAQRGPLPCHHCLVTIAWRPALRQTWRVRRHERPFVLTDRERQEGVWSTVENSCRYRVDVPRHWSNLTIALGLGAILLTRSPAALPLLFLVQFPVNALHPSTYQVTASFEAIELTSGATRRHIVWSDVAAFGCFARKTRRPMTFWPFREPHAIGTVVLKSGHSVQLPGFRSVIDPSTGIGSSSCSVLVEAFRRYGSDVVGDELPLVLEPCESADWIGRPFSTRWW
jgi:hypothetical protein